MQIHIKTLTGKTFSLEVEGSITIAQFRDTIFHKYDIPQEQQRIIHSGRELHNTHVEKLKEINSSITFMSDAEKLCLLENVIRPSIVKLNKECTLNDYNIIPDSTLVLVLRLKGC